MQETWVHLLIRELRSHMLCGIAKKKKGKKKKIKKVEKKTQAYFLIKIKKIHNA